MSDGIPPGEARRKKRVRLAGGANFFKRRRVLHGRGIAQRLIQVFLPDEPPHDFSTLRFGELFLYGYD